VRVLPACFASVLCQHPLPEAPDCHQKPPKKLYPKKTGAIAPDGCCGKRCGSAMRKSREVVQ
jgi:hypothetical protein